MSNPAESYESYMVPTLFAPWASHRVQSADPQHGERVLDLACGTGIVARQVAPRLGTKGAVTGLDLNPHMLAVLAQPPNGRGWPSNGGSDGPNSSRSPMAASIWCCASLR